jgi:hypothetical protein
MPIIDWLLHADHEVAPMCRSVTGRDEDINADAQRVVGMISKVLAEYPSTR